jgi:hypothetical protein
MPANSVFEVKLVGNHVLTINRLFSYDENPQKIAAWIFRYNSIGQLRFGKKCYRTDTLTQ